MFCETRHGAFFLSSDRTVQRLKKEYMDPTSKQVPIYRATSGSAKAFQLAFLYICHPQNASRVAEGLADIQNIMRQNLEEVLNRGEKLES